MQTYTFFSPPFPFLPYFSSFFHSISVRLPIGWLGSKDGSKLLACVCVCGKHPLGIVAKEHPPPRGREKHPPEKQRCPLYCQRASFDRHRNLPFRGVVSSPSLLEILIIEMIRTLFGKLTCDLNINLKNEIWKWRFAGF